MTEKIELHTAFTWICPCGMRNFEKAINLEDPEMIKEAQEAMGDGAMVLAPTSVQCTKCDNYYEVETDEDDESGTVDLGSNYYG